MTASLPIVRLKPKADVRAVRHGVPWVYEDDLVLDRRTKALPAGSIVTLEDAGRTPLATAALNTKSKMALRILSLEPGAAIDEQWFEARIRAALRHREALYDAPFYRLIHAEADGLPGVVVDRFCDTLVLQPNAAWVESLLEPLVAALMRVTGCRNLYKNASGRTRSLEGLDAESIVLEGEIAGPLQVSMNGAIYSADILGGQKTGLFYDQRPNHAFAAGLAKDARVLDVFSHVGGFGLACLAGGARDVTAVDSSAAALELAEQGSAAMGRDAAYTTRKGDAFDVMAALRDEGQTFDLVIADPPAFAPSKKALTRGLRAYERVARMTADLVAPGGTVILCSCSHAAELDKFRAACIRGLGRAGRAGALFYTGFAGPDHPIHPQLASGAYLKALAFRCP